MAKKPVVSTPAAGGTPWKGRLRSHHGLSSPFPRSPNSQDSGDEAQALSNPGRRRARDEGDGADAHPPRLPPRRSPRLAAGNRARRVVVDRPSKECEVRGIPSAIKPLRKSPRFHTDYRISSKAIVKKESYQKQPSLPLNPQEVSDTRNAQNTISKGKNLENPTRRSQRNAAVKASAGMKSQNEDQQLCEDYQDIPPKRKLVDLCCKKSEMQELKPNNCLKLTRKRKRGTEGRPSSRKQNHKEPKSLPPGYQETAPRIEARSSIHKKSGKGIFITQPQTVDDRLMNAEENNEEQSGTKGGILLPIAGSDDWTEEQDIALRQAYFTARPSPHFWKKVSKMVPGKSAEDCFNRVHSDLSTPTPIAPRPRKSKTTFSPLGHFTLSDSKFSDLLEPAVRRKMTTKKRSLAAQKTVRHLLKKHCLVDQAQEADHFSIFETSPAAIQLNASFDDSPGTPDNNINSGSFQKFSESPATRKKSLSKLKTNEAEPSPAVLKPVKNVILHEKYIDQLSRRESTKRPRKKAAGTTATTDSVRTLSEQQGGGLKAARNALISEATDFISHFRKMQANSLAHVMENNEDDECDTSDACHHDGK